MTEPGALSSGEESRLTTKRLADELLIAGLGDWVHLPGVVWVTETFSDHEDSREIIDLATEALGLLLREGLIQIGDVTDGGFFEWTLAAEETLDRVRRECAALTRNPLPGDVFWIANTPLGDRRANKALKGHPNVWDSRLNLLKRPTPSSS